MPDASAIFISHSSADGELAARLRKALLTALRRRDLVPLLDEDGLAPGDRWHSVLYRWLAECNGGVLMLTPAALSKDWVRKEATILAWRAALRPEMALVGVLVGDVTADDVRAAFPALGVEDSQFVRVPEGAGDKKVTAAARAIAGAFPPGLDLDDDMRRWVRELDGQLGPLAEHKLEDLAVALDVPVPEWRVEPDRRRRLAYELLHCETMTALETAVDPIARTVADPHVFLDHVTPVTVPADAASAVLRVFHRPAGKRVAALGGHWGETADLWMGRAVCSARGYGQEEFAPTLSGDDAVAEVCEPLRAWLRRTTGSRRDDAVGRQLEVIERRPGRRVAVLPMRTDERSDALPATVVRGVVETMRAEQPLLVLLLLTGEDHDALDRLGLDDVDRIEPGPTDAVAESDDNSAVRRLRNILEAR